MDKRLDVDSFHKDLLAILAKHLPEEHESMPSEDGYVFMTTLIGTAVALGISSRWNMKEIQDTVATLYPLIYQKGEKDGLLPSPISHDN